MKPPKSNQPTLDLEKGTAPALKFLADRELAARKTILELSAIYENELALARKAEPAMDGIDFMARANSAKKALSEAEAAHLKQAQALREMDKVVSPDKRDADEKITKAEGIKLFKMMAIYGNNAYQTFGTRAITEIREARNEQDAWAKTGAILTESLVNSIKVAVSESHLPAWALESVEGVI